MENVSDGSRWWNDPQLMALNNSQQKILSMKIVRFQKRLENISTSNGYCQNILWKTARGLLKIRGRAERTELSAKIVRRPVTISKS